MNAMEWIQTLLISGLCIPSFCADYRQHCFISTPKSWADAQSYCRERGSDLATIDDMGAMQSLLPLNADKAHDEWWIGLHFGAPIAWKWSLADNDFYQEGERDYRNFPVWDEGNPYGAQYLGTWFSYDNTNSVQIMCYDANEQGEDRYVLIRQWVSWTEAQAYCRLHHTDLVSIRSSEENQAVVNASDGNFVWIGLYQEGEHWSDRRNSSFRHWGPGSVVGLSPQHCAVMTSQISGTWSQQPCDELRPFLCTCASKRVLKVKVRSEDMQKLNDPAMKTAVVKETQRMLNAATLSNYHKIVWKTNSDGQVFTKEQCQEEEQSQDLCDTV